MLSAFLAALLLLGVGILSPPAFAIKKNLVSEVESDVSSGNNAKALEKIMLEVGAKSKGAEAEALIQLARTVLTRFSSEKANNLFEQGLTVFSDSPATASQRFSEATKLEPLNAELAFFLARSFLATNQCEDADRAITPFQSFERALPELKVITAQVRLCRGSKEELALLKNLLETPPTDTPMTLVVAEYYYKTGQPSPGLMLLEERQKVDGAHPELAYWNLKLRELLKNPSEAMMRKYLDQCKALSGRAKRKLLSEPMLCRRTQEVDQLLRSQQGAGS